MADAPWIKVYTGDFLQGVGAANMTAEQIGVYAVVLFLIAERGAPIEDDRRWLAGRAGCRSTRHCGQIIDKLIDLGKLESRNGLLGNRRMIEEVGERSKKSDQARSAAIARWHGDDAELPFDENISNLSSKKTRTKKRDNSQLSGREKSKKSQSSAISEDADAKIPSRARATESQNSESNDRTSDSLGRGGQIEKAWQAISAAAGFVPTDARRIADAYDLTREWLDAGIDLEGTILPTIRAVISQSQDHTSSLRRFDAKVRHQHARTGASPTKTYRAPDAPILLFDGEPDGVRPIREALLAHFGHGTYPLMCHRVRFSISEAMGGGQLLQIGDDGTGAATRFKDQIGSGRLAAIARKHGFADAW